MIASPRSDKSERDLAVEPTSMREIGETVIISVGISV
jgi:hypothetical protein